MAVGETDAYSARVVAQDSIADLALLQIDDPPPAVEPEFAPVIVDVEVEFIVISYALVDTEFIS